MKLNLMGVHKEGDKGFGTADVAAVFYAMDLLPPFYSDTARIIAKTEASSCTDKGFRFGIPWRNDCRPHFKHGPGHPVRSLSLEG